MTSATTVLIIIAAVIAFWAGRRWQHNSRTWQDHRKAAILAKDFGTLRWKTLWAALLAAVLLAGYLAGSGLLAAGVKPPPPPSPTCTPADLHTRRPTPAATTTQVLIGAPVTRLSVLSTTRKDPSCHGLTI